MSPRCFGRRAWTQHRWAYAVLKGDDTVILKTSAKFALEGAYERLRFAENLLAYHKCPSFLRQCPAFQLATQIVAEARDSLVKGRDSSNAASSSDQPPTDSRPARWYDAWNGSWKTSRNMRGPFST